jgi:hypothetical protein
MKRTVYYCPGCKQRIVRLPPNSPRFFKSYCATAGTTVRMRKSRDQKAPPTTYRLREREG